MLENFATKTWRATKKMGAGDTILKRFFEPLIGFLAKKEKMSLSPDENWGTRLRYLLRWYEPGSTKICKKFIRPGMNVLDIGADVGYYSRLFSELTGPQGRVWAFEPFPASFSLLKKNTELSRYQNIFPIKKAVSDVSGNKKFFAGTKPGKHTFYDISKINPKYSAKDNLTVQSTTIDDFLSKEGNPPINFIKMDIEGAEPEALAGMRDTVSRSKNLAMIVEFNVKALLHLAGKDPSLFLKDLENMGFKISVILSDGKLKPIEDFSQPFDEKGYLNLLCVKR